MPAKVRCFAYTQNTSYLGCLQYIRFSVEENNNKWGTLYTRTWPNYDVWGNYLNEVQNLKNWLNERFEWLKNEYDGM